jgi:hypothetical protein
MQAHALQADHHISKEAMVSNTQQQHVKCTYCQCSSSTASSIRRNNASDSHTRQVEGSATARSFALQLTCRNDGRFHSFLRQDAFQVVQRRADTQECSTRWRRHRIAVMCRDSSSDHSIWWRLTLQNKRSVYEENVTRVNAFMKTYQRNEKVWPNG